MMILSGLWGHVIFWIGAVGLAVFSTAGIFVSWLAAVGIRVPAGRLLEDSPCIINFDWIAVVPFLGMAGLSWGAMFIGKRISAHCPRPMKGVSKEALMNLDSPHCDESPRELVNVA